MSLFLAYSYTRPFLDIPPLWDYWIWLLLPLVAGVSIVYKSIKCATMKRVPWEATVIFAWIIIGMIGASAALAGIVKLMEKL